MYLSNNSFCLKRERLGAWNWWILRKMIYYLYGYDINGSQPKNFCGQKLLGYTVCINCNLKLKSNIYYCIHYTPFNEKGIWKNLNIHDIITNLINKVSTRLNFNDNDFHFVHLSVSRLKIKISPVLSFSAEIMDREIPTGGDIKFPPKYGVNGNTYMIKNLT